MTEQNVPPPAPADPSSTPARPKTAGLAIGSLVCGILAFCLFFLTGIPAILMGIFALRKINNSGGTIGGKGIAIGGIIAGGVGMAAWVMIGLLAVIAVPGFIRSRQLSQGRALINDARQIDAATDQWALENGLSNGTPVNAASVSVYLKAGALQSKVAALGPGNGAIEDVLPMKTIYLGNVGSTQVTITRDAKTALPAVTDWGYY